MAWFFGDGFDLYAVASDGALGHWDSVGGGSLVAGRFAGSRAYAHGNNTGGLVKASGSNDAIHHIFFSVMVTGTISGTNNWTFFTLFDGATAQCTVAILSGGDMVIRSGIVTGATLATYPAAVTASNVWYAFEIEVVINNVTGSFAVRKNGNTVNDFLATGLNTRAGTTNNYANRLQCAGQNSPSSAIDDVLWRSDAAAVPWGGDLRCYTRRAIADAAVQWTRSAGTNQLLWSRSLTMSLAANTAVYWKITTHTNGGLLNSISIDYANGGGGTGHFKMAIFADNAGAVGALLATSSEITNPSNAFITVNFPSPARIVPGTPFWIGLIQDAAMTCGQVNIVGTGCTAAMSSTTVTYASWPVSSPAGAVVTSGINTIGMTLAITPQYNSDCVGEAQQDTTSSYVYSSTIGQADLYTIDSITSTPAVILGVTTRGLLQKSDAGTRTATVELKSGSTTVHSATIALGTGWGWVGRVDTVDPATGSAWTAIGVSSAQIGVTLTG